MICPHCESEVASGQRFCSDCGAPLALRCPVCGSGNPPRKRFCGDCGAALTDAAPIPPEHPPSRIEPEAAAAGPERRQLTVMFCDLVGSTALSTRMDPEDLRELISSYYGCINRVATRFDGFVARYMGDGVLVYFGFPQAHEDDPEQAVRAALALVEAVAQISAAERLQARVGIATGLVVAGDLIGSGPSHEQAVVGETPNLAARLQALADPGTVVIAESTRRLVGSLFELQDLGPQELKGPAEPQRAWRVLGESRVRSRFEALRSGETPLVGREEEAELLRRRWAQARQGEGCVVSIAGEPGVGKSRLVAALQESLRTEPHYSLRYFCSPRHQDSPLFPVITRLERAAGLNPEDAPKVKLDKLEALLAPSTPRQEDVALLAGLLSLPDCDRYPALDLTPQRRKQRILEALLWQLGSLARDRPVLLVFEDLHWVDPTTRELLAITVQQIERLPALLIATARPEFSPAWRDAPHVTARVLNRLDRKACAALVRSIPGGNTLPSRVVDEIVMRSDGVPLFAEEVTKAMVESGEGAAGAAPGSAVEVPASLQISLMARLDRLGPPAREVAQTGAVIGREFPFKLLSAIAPQDGRKLQSGLDRLVGAGLVRRRGTLPDAVFSFSHALVQDTAYKSLLRDRRQLLHARTAAALEAHGAGAAPEIIAHHFTQAGDAERAVIHWYRAGERAARQSANEEAIGHLSRGLRMLDGLPETRERAASELPLQFLLAQAAMNAKGYASRDAAQALGRARELCGTIGDDATLFSTLWGQTRFELIRGDHERERRTAEEMLERAGGAASPEAMMIAHCAAGCSEFHLGHPAPARTHFEQAGALYERLEDPTALARRYNADIGAVSDAYRADCLWLLGYPDRALHSGRRSLVRVERAGHRYAWARGLYWNAVHQTYRRQWRAAAERAQQAIEMAQHHGFAMVHAVARVVRGAALIAFGPESALTEIDSGLADYAAMGALFQRPYFLSLRAHALQACGRTVEALAALHEAEALMERTDERYFEAEIHRIAGDLEHALGEPNAEARYLKALDVARAQEARSLELRAATSLATRWSSQGRRREALDLLAPVRAVFSEGFDLPDLKDAEAMLHALVRERAG